MQCACAVPPCVLCCAALGNRLTRSLDGLSAPASVPLQGTLSPFNDARVAAGFAILSCVEWYLTHDDGQLRDIVSLQKNQPSYQPTRKHFVWAFTVYSARNKKYFLHSFGLSVSQPPVSLPFASPDKTLNIRNTQAMKTGCWFLSFLQMVMPSNRHHMHAVGAR